jgi:hypothetical protein
MLEMSLCTKIERIAQKEDVALYWHGLDESDDGTQNDGDDRLGPIDPTKSFVGEKVTSSIKRRCCARYGH